MVCLPSHDLYRRILLDNNNDARLPRMKNWTWSFHACLKKLGYNAVDCDNSLPVKDKACVQVLLQDALQKEFLGLSACPRTCPHQGAVLCTYLNWFSRPAWPCKSFLSAPVHISLMRFFLRFRTGCHDLSVVTGRLNNVPRDEWICPACSNNAVCDELHVVLVRVPWGYTSATFSPMIIQP